MGSQAESWIEAPLTDEWTVAYRVMPQDERPIVAEVRIFPSVPEKGSLLRPHAGHWDPDMLDKSGGAVPLGGITTGLLRAVRLASDLDAGLKDGAVLLKWVPSIGPRLAKKGFRRLRRKSPRPGHGWTDERLVHAALFYVERGGRRPVADLAQAWGLSPSQARDLLQAARKRGYLSAGERGKTSRVLTQRAKAFLAKESR